MEYWTAMDAIHAWLNSAAKQPIDVAVEQLANIVETVEVAKEMISDWVANGLGPNID